MGKGNCYFGATPQGSYAYGALGSGEFAGAVVKKCVHTGSSPVFMWKGLSFYGANADGVYDVDAHANLVVDAAGVYPSGDFIVEKPSWVRAGKIRPNVIVLGWRDYSPPPSAMTVGVWKSIADDAINRGRVSGIVCCCVGGHGRTGTALAAFAISLGVVGSLKEAVELVRKGHCNKAIESLPQLLYLNNLVAQRGGEREREEEVARYVRKEKVTWPGI